MNFSAMPSADRFPSSGKLDMLCNVNRIRSFLPPAA